jgi:hypothetical protein
LFEFGLERSLQVTVVGCTGHVCFGWWSLDKRVRSFSHRPRKGSQTTITKQTWLSRAIDVVSPPMALAMPKSISFKAPSTSR